MRGRGQTSGPTSGQTRGSGAARARQGGGKGAGYRMFDDLTARFGDDAMALRSCLAPEAVADADLPAETLWLARRIDLALGARPTARDLLEAVAALGAYADHVARSTRPAPAGDVAPPLPTACGTAGCAGDLPVTAPELFLLADAAARAGVAMTAGPGRAGTPPCALLAPRGARRPSGERPLACRLDGVVARAMQDALRAVCLARGWDGRMFTLAEAFPRALGDPGLLDAWLGGVRLFDPAARPGRPEANSAIERLAGAL